MDDPFQTLSLPARPWIESSQLQSHFHSLALSTHPDAQPLANESTPSTNATDQKTTSSFTQLNEARQALENPVTRLQHLLEKEAPGEVEALKRLQTPLEISQYFLEVATLLREVSAFCEQRSASKSALQRAILHSENSALRADVDRTLARLDALWSQCELQLRAADAVWERRTPQMLHQLVTIQREMTFLQRWRSQLREARLQLVS